jgi:hypothetical protein
MKKYFLLCVLVTAIGSTFAFKFDKTTLTGYIGDAMCAAKGKANNPEHAACAAKCIKGGSAAVLVVGDKVYAITDQKKAVKFAGKKVIVEGTVTEDSIDITKIAEAK